MNKYEKYADKLGGILDGVTVMGLTCAQIYYLYNWELQNFFMAITACGVWRCSMELCEISKKLGSK